MGSFGLLACNLGRLQKALQGRRCYRDGKLGTSLCARPFGESWLDLAGPAEEGFDGEELAEQSVCHEYPPGQPVAVTSSRDLQGGKCSTTDMPHMQPSLQYALQAGTHDGRTGATCMSHAGEVTHTVKAA